MRAITISRPNYEDPLVGAECTSGRRARGGNPRMLREIRFQRETPCKKQLEIYPEDKGAGICSRGGKSGIARRGELNWQQ
jgi:hypothetical protein